MKSTLGRLRGTIGGILALAAVMVAACASTAADATDATRDAPADAHATDDGVTVPWTLTWRDAPPDSAPAGRPLSAGLAVCATAGGQPIAGASLSAWVLRGGGDIAPASATTDASGVAHFTWTLGIVPVANEVRVTAGNATLEAEVRATLPDGPLHPQRFGAVDAFLTAASIAGSTEDLAFHPANAEEIVLGVPGGLLAVNPDGSTHAIAVRGDPLVQPLGLAYDREGVLWTADLAGRALRRVAPDGTVTTALIEVAGEPLVGPNDVAVGPDGHIYLSDPCRAALFRFDPRTGTVVATLSFDSATEGGPNGFAFADPAPDDPTGAPILWVATENTALPCRDYVAPTARLGGLYRARVTDDGFGPLEAVAPGLGHFGDGVAVDAEGNVYAIFDEQVGLGLGASTVFVLPAGDDTPVAFLVVPEGPSPLVFANAAFGQGAFGATALYLALLALPPVIPESARGLARLEVGLHGRRLP